MARVFEKFGKLDFGAKFWTCEDPISYFCQNPRLSDIKFGGDTVLKKFEVVIDKFGGGNKSWNYVDPVDLVDHFYAWMEQKCDQLSRLYQQHLLRQKYQPSCRISAASTQGGQQS